MEAAEKIYEGRNTSKTQPREDANRASHGRKRKGGEAASPTNPDTSRTGKRKTRNAGHPSDRLTRGKTCLLHGTGHSTEECKGLKGYSTEYTVQRPHKEEACSGGNKKQGKTVQFDGKTEEVNSMTASDVPITRKKKEKFRQRRLRLIRTLQSLKRRNALTGLTA